MVLKLRNFINNTFKTVEKKLKDRSIDSEHYIAFFYCFGMMGSLLVNVSFYLFIASFLDTTHLITSFIVYLLFIMINLVVVYRIGKKCIFYFKDRRFMTSFFSFLLFLPFLMFLLCWLMILFGNLSILLNPYGGGSGISPEQLKEAYIRAVNSNITAIKGVTVYVTILAISAAYNIFVPQKWQTVDISLKNKILRLLWKITCLILPFLIVYVYSLFNTTNFAIWGFLSTCVIFFVDPKNIAGLIFDYHKYSDANITESALGKAQAFKAYYLLLVVAWSISLFGFSDQPLGIRFLVFLIGYSIFLSIWKGAKFYYKDRQESRDKIIKETKENDSDIEL
ncbi:hypothetical protein SMULJ23_1628 [Streptococcus mutans LJ23]|uniref:hypothetical protein n=1 Tax=Streptococcus mutans TaxID=1309 RepID=UPI000264F11C|nr:hypothetical protein [Streptococcus mutans]BAL69962.1 hypothetical protein SMULJ23_1628 [Streptococcus mutans LJ23]